MKLTKQEVRILALLANGCLGKQVSSTLFISPKTVQSHCRNIKKRLGAKTLTQAVVMADRSGLLTTVTPR